jgi:hypothetical protein
MDDGMVVRLITLLGSSLESIMLFSVKGLLVLSVCGNGQRVRRGAANGCKATARLRGLIASTGALSSRCYIN